MLIPPARPQLLRTISLALEDQDPERYQRLLQSQELQTWLENRAEEMEEAFFEAENAIIDGMHHFQRTQPDGDAAAWMQTQLLALWHQILVDFLEFQPPLTEEATTASPWED